MRAVLVPGACVLVALASLAAIGMAAVAVRAFRLVLHGTRALADSGRDESGGSP